MPQNAWKKFFFRGHQFPVCARCTGFYITLFMYFVYAYFFYIDYNIYLISFAILLLLPSFIDGLTQLFELRESNNALRFITGLMGGIGLGIIIKAIKWFIYIHL